MVAVVVEDQHRLARLHGTGNDVPGRDDQIVADCPAPPCSGTPPVATNTTSGASASTSAAVAQVEKRSSTPSRSNSAQAPVDDADQLAPPRRARDQQDLPAGLLRRLEHQHRMAALGGDARRLQPGRPGADHHHAPRAARRCARRRAASSLRARSRRCGCTAPRCPRRCGRGSSSRRRRGGCRCSCPAAHLARDMRVGDQRAGHADHVELARGDRVPRGRDVVDARGVEHRNVRRRAHLAGEIQMRRGAHAGDRDHVGQRVVGVDVAADDVEEIDQPGRLEAPRDLDALRARQADLPVLVGDHAHADQEIRPDRVAHRLQHAERERACRLSRLPP